MESVVRWVGAKVAEIRLKLSLMGSLNLAITAEPEN
jgi:hypothetical protein